MWEVDRFERTIRLKNEEKYRKSDTSPNKRSFMPAYKQPNGKWYVSFVVKNWEQKVRRIFKRGFCTKKEALDYERKYKVYKEGSPDMLLMDFCELYLNDVSPSLKESTLATKKNILYTHIAPKLGNKRLCDLTPVDIMRWQNGLLSYRDESGEKYSQTYLKTIRNQLSAILNHAVRYYDLPKNVVFKANKIGSKNPVNTNFWTTEEYQRFIVTMEDRPEAFFSFEILYWTGIREGELLALTVEDFDFRKESITIKKTYHRSQGRDIITDPKTPKSNRVVVMPHHLAEELEGYFSIVKPRSGERIFTNSKFSLKYCMECGCKTSGVKVIRIHDLRHSHVSLLIHLGYTALAIADRMGHEASDITFRYAHLFPSVQNEMAEKLNQIQEIL